MRHLVGRLSRCSDEPRAAEEGELARLPDELRREALLRSVSRFKVRSTPSRLLGSRIDSMVLCVVFWSDCRELQPKGSVV